jgi:hypothetical protein
LALAHVLIGEPDSTSPGHALDQRIPRLMQFSVRRLGLASINRMGQMNQGELRRNFFRTFGGLPELVMHKERVRE